MNVRPKMVAGKIFAQGFTFNVIAFKKQKGELKLNCSL